MAGVELGEQSGEALQIVGIGIGIGNDVKVLRGPDDTMSVHGEPSDDDVLHARVLQRPEQWLRIEDVAHALRECLNASANRFANSV